MPSLRRSFLGLLALLTVSGSALALPAGTSLADAGDAVAGTPRATATSITAGSAHSCAITGTPGASVGSVYCWGGNGFGQLGLGDTLDRADQPGEMGANLPAVDLGRPAVSLSAGSVHTCAIVDDGTVRCWGSNSAGRLGLGDTADRGDQPGEMGAALTVDLGAGRTARMISAGFDHTCAIVDDGSVRCWGGNANGQLGLGDTANRGDQPGEMGSALPAVDLGPSRTAIAISAGAGHTCAILDTHAVRCWGRNDGGQLGVGDTADRGDQPGEMGNALPTVDLGTGMTAQTLTTGAAHTCAQITTTAVRCWGANNLGQLGQGSTIARGDQAGEMGDALPALDLAPQAARITGLTAMDNSTCAVWDATSGPVTSRVSCWGGNSFGELGTGSTTADGTTGGALWAPTAISTAAVASATGGGSHVCLVMLDHDVRCLGWNAFGQLGAGDTNNLGDVLIEVLGLADLDLRSDADIAELAVGFQHGCAVLTNGAVKCWGANQSGQLGLGDVNPRGDQPGEIGDAVPTVDLGTGRTAVDVAAGAEISCAVLDNGAVKCWGNNGAGQLGIGDTANRGDQPGEMGDALPTVPLGTGRTAIAVEAGFANVCAILDDHTLKCWGENISGQLAQGNVADRGDQPGELGDALAPIGFGPGRTVDAVAVGQNTVCALLDDDSVSCWGEGGSGQLGFPAPNWGSSSTQLGANMPRVDLGPDRTALQVDIRGTTACAVRDDARVVCWGNNEFGQLGIGSLENIGDDPGEMGAALVPVPLATGQTPVSVTTANRHACARFTSGRVQCWGWNASGQLGIDQAGDRGDAPGELGDALPLVTFPVAAPATEIDAGGSHTCARFGVDRVQCWGQNGLGQFGNGTSLDAGTAARPVAGAARTQLGVQVDTVLVLPATPAIPTDVTATAGSAQAQVAWTAPHADGGSPVTGYRIERSLDSGSTWSVLVANTGSAATTRTVPGLTGGQPIRFRVAAINAVGVSAASLPSAAVTPASVPYLALTPARLADTRPDGETVDGQGVATGLVGAGQTLTVQVTGRANVPAGAAAAVLNVTAVTPAGPGFLTVYPCDAGKPDASSVNYQTGQVVPNAVVSKLSASGTVCIFTLAATHVLVDVNGVYPAGAAYLPVTPGRLADTRPDGQTVDGQGAGTGILRNQFVAVLTVQVTGRNTIPTGATAAVLNVTAVTPDRAGFLTVFPCDQDQPNASSVNFQPGQVVANAVVTKLAADGTVCVASSAEAAHVLVDVVGAFPAGADYTPLVPARLVDTRPAGLTVDGQGSGSGVLGAGQTLQVQVAGRDTVPADATSAVLNVTAVTPSGPGFLTVYPCDAGQPNASSVNYQGGQVVPNAVFTKLAANGTVCIFTLAATHVLVDVTGAS